MRSASSLCHVFNQTVTMHVSTKYQLIMETYPVAHSLPVWLERLHHLLQDDEIF